MQVEGQIQGGILQGLGLALAVGAVSLALTRALPRTAFLSEVLVSLVLGAVVLNTPLGRAIGLAMPGPDRDPDNYAPGLRFTGTWVLRLAIILMGLKVQTSFFDRREVLLIACVAAAALPSRPMPTAYAPHAASGLSSAMNPYTAAAAPPMMATAVPEITVPLEALLLDPPTPAAAAPLHRLDLDEARLPETQHVLRDVELVGDLADGTKCVRRLFQGRLPSQAPEAVSGLPWSLTT